MLRITVPATSANLGPGFDALGLAVDLRLEVLADLTDHDALHYSGEGSVADSPDNLIHAGFREVLREVGAGATPVTFEVRNPIPLARGLGSSSAALVAGMVAANELTGRQLDDDRLFQLAAATEGHPDNVAPAIFGGFTVAAKDAAGVFRHACLPLPSDWRLLFGVPAFELATSDARAVLPETFTRAEVVLTSGRAALWVAAVATNEPSLLAAASLDVLHQPHRARLVPGMLEAMASVTAAGAHAAYLSGAGPTLAAVSDDASSAAAKAALEEFVGSFPGAGGKVLDLAGTGGYTVAGCSQP